MVVILALIPRGALLYLRLGVAHTDLRWLGGSDVPGWLGMVDHFTHHLDFSYWLLGARPPLYPLVIALVVRLGGNLFYAAILQIALGSLTAALAFLLARRLFMHILWLPDPARWALIAGIIVALDPASVSADATLLADPLFNLLMVTFLFFLARFVWNEHWIDLTLAALAMALAMLTRPTAIYLWLVAPLILIPLVRRWWYPALILVAVGLAVYLGWSARNLAYQGVFTYSTQTNFSLLFLRALSAEHLATGANPADLEVQYVQQLYRTIGDEESAALAVPEHFWRFLVADEPRLYAEMGHLARQKLAQYWPYALLGTGVGAWRMFGLTRALPPWFTPAELIYHAALYGFVAWGTWQAFRRRDWALLLFTVVPICYVTGLTLLAQTSALDTRMRTAITAPLSILATCGMGQVLRSRAKKQAQTPASRDR